MAHCIEEIGNDVRVTSDYYLGMDEAVFVTRVFKLLSKYDIDRALGRVQSIRVAFVKNLWNTDLLQVTYLLSGDSLEVNVEFDYNIEEFYVYND